MNWLGLIKYFFSAMLIWLSLGHAAESNSDSGFGDSGKTDSGLVSGQTESRQSRLNEVARRYGQEVRYEVFRKEKLIGTHVLRFKVSENELEVVAASDLVVRYLGIPVYKYSYSATERWEDGKLMSVESIINDNRKKTRRIDAIQKERLLEITDRGEVKTAPKIKFPSNHWHSGVVSEKRIYHTTHGKVHTVKIQDLGEEKIKLSDENDAQKFAVVSAKKYRYIGGFSALVWYDAKQRWVRLVFNADDGSRIDYRCVSCL